MLYIWEPTSPIEYPIRCLEFIILMIGIMIYVLLIHILIKTVFFYYFVTLQQAFSSIGLIPIELLLHYFIVFLHLEKWLMGIGPACLPETQRLAFLPLVAH